MVRVKRGNVARKRRKKVFKRAKGFRGSLRKVFRPAKQAVTKALKHSTRARKERKRSTRALWITRINIASREHGLTYGKLIHGLKKANVSVDRKILSDLAVNDKAAFAKLVETAAGKSA